jgi:anti-sigma factor RsiW
MNVTRDVIADLWALVSAGEASDDSRRLVDQFLAADPAFAATLKTEDARMTNPADVSLPPNLEVQTLNQTRQQLRRRSPFRLPALVVTGLALVRLNEAIAFVASPRPFIGTASVALVCWILYVWHTRRLRESALVSK